jgi:hypothetical protein
MTGGAMSIYLDAVEDLLIQWGRAARGETIRLGVRTGILGRLKGTTVKSASIDPEDFDDIDDIISKLKLIDSQMHDVATEIFLKNRDYDAVSRELNLTKQLIGKIKHSVVAYVAGSLNDK